MKVGPTKFSHTQLIIAIRKLRPKLYISDNKSSASSVVLPEEPLRQIPICDQDEIALPKLKVEFPKLGVWGSLKKLIILDATSRFKEPLMKLLISSGLFSEVSDQSLTSDYILSVQILQEKQANYFQETCEIQVLYTLCTKQNVMVWKKSIETLSEVTFMPLPFYGIEWSTNDDDSLRWKRKRVQMENWRRLRDAIDFVISDNVKVMLEELAKVDLTVA